MEHADCGCAALHRTHSAPDLRIRGEEDQAQNFLVTFASRRIPAWSAAAITLDALPAMESNTSVISHTPNPFESEDESDTLPSPMQAELATDHSTEAEALLQALRKQLCDVADALEQTASTMTPSATVMPFGAMPTQPVFSTKAGPSLINVVAEAAAQAQHVALQMEKNATQGEVRQDYSMRAHLITLNKEDPESVFIVRRIHKLGVSARTALAKHFSQYGEVEKVLVADCKVKASQGPNGQPVMRAGNMGFIIMKSADEVARVLARGSDQLIGRYKIKVQKYAHGKSISNDVGDVETWESLPSMEGTNSNSADENEKGGTSSTPAKAFNAVKHLEMPPMSQGCKYY